MSTISFQTFSCIQQLDQEVVRVENEVGEIESQLQSPHSSADYYQLFHDLDRALLPLKQLKETARTLENCSSKLLQRLLTLEERSRTLYGNLVNTAVECEVVEIKSEALSLEESLVSGNLLSVAKKVDALKQHISIFKHDHALSKHEIVELSSIERFIARVEEFLETPTKLQQIRLQNIFEYGDLDPATAELLMELFELSEMFESGHPLASKRKEKLPVSIQKRLEAHVKELEKNVELPSDKIEACALLATSLELSQGRRLESPLEEVARYYEGWDAVNNSASRF